MTARLSPQQRWVLDELAHMRVAPEDAVLTTWRLAQLTGRNLSRTWDTVYSLLQRGLIERLDTVGSKRRDFRWRITDKGREALG